jgi:hypothetical protein
MHPDDLPICASLAPMINRNLCLPIIESGIICPCEKEIDIYGDHFFNAKNTAKCNHATESATAYSLSLLKLVNMQVSFPANEMYSQNL